MSAKFSDIIPPNKRTIRNVPLNISVEDTPTHVKKKTLEKDTRELMKIIDKERRVSRSKTIWGVAIFCVAVLVLIIISKFSNATATLVASNKPIVLGLNLNLSHTGTSTNSVDYDILTLSVSDTIPESAIRAATGTAALGTKATGSVTVYNNFSSTPQILIKNTRLEAPDGKIFFLTDKVTVPGQTTSKGVTTPGSVVAKVIAEKEGTAYNVGSKDFTFPGLKSSPRYKTVYAKTKTEVVGGSAAKSKVVIDKGTLDELHTALLADALKQIEAGKADDYIVLPGAVQDEIRVEGTSTAFLDVSALLLKKADLAIQIQINKNLDMNLSPENTEDIIIGTSMLSVSIPDETKLNDLSKTSSIKIGLNGTTTISSNLASDVLKKELAGLSFESAEKLLKNKIGVEAVNLEIWPWWVKTVPTTKDRINIKIENN